jgi:hypothetical protein
MHRPLADRHQMLKCTLPQAPASNRARRPMRNLDPAAIGGQELTGHPG